VYFHQKVCTDDIDGSKATQTLATNLNKMTPAELTTTLGFLTDAGHLLATAAPETSAYVMSQRNGLMLEHDMALTDKQRQHVCSCCGHIMLLGQGSELQVKAGQRASQKPRSTRVPKGNRAQRLPSRPQLETCPGPTKAITCGHCGRLTNVQLPAPARISRRKVRVEKATTKASEKATSVSSAAQEVPSQKTTSNASSKKRAKSRKAGLQALLDQSNASRNSGPGLGLSLADFMQK
jgi:hypothetical protein